VIECKNPYGTGGFVMQAGEAAHCGQLRFVVESATGQSRPKPWRKAG
jgi:hypothetical protein